MKIEKIKEKMKKLLNRIISVALPVSILTMSCGTSALVVRAAESEFVNASGRLVNYKDGKIKYDDETVMQIIPSKGYEVLACINDVKSGDVTIYYNILIFIKSKSENRYYDLTTASENGYCNVQGSYKSLVNNEYRIYTWQEYNRKNVPYKSGENSDYVISNFSLTGNVKLFKNQITLESYVQFGDTSGMIEVKDPENEKNWYLKNVSYKVTADDSPSSEAGADATYIHFSWDTDNLQDGDLLEIKTYNYYKKILGEKLSGFHDFVTYSDGVAASSGKYSFSQYTATKAWFNSLENKPLAFKEYDTTDYYLRPVRMGTLGVEKYGGWVHIKMGRSTPTSSPYIEDIEYGDFDDDNNWTVDEDLTDKNGGHHGVDQGGGYIPPDQSDNPFTGTNIAGIFSYFYDFMKQIPAMLGDLPALVGNIISFLPKPIIAFIGIGVIVAIILRIVGR